MFRLSDCSPRSSLLSLPQNIESALACPLRSFILLSSSAQIASRRMVPAYNSSLHFATGMLENPSVPGLRHVIRILSLDWAGRPVRTILYTLPIPRCFGLMPPRLPSQGFHAYVSFYACATAPSPARSARVISSARMPCPRHASTRRILTGIYSSGIDSLGKVGALSPILDNHVNTPQRRFHASSLRSAPKDPYQVLGVGKDATAAELKKTYFAVRSMGVFLGRIGALISM
jgi:hypothetical protein